jgi:hypothetical protein
MRAVINNVLTFSGGLFAFSLYIGLFAGWAYWMWMAIHLGSFGMFVLGLLGPGGAIAAVLGLWSFLFGIPGWLLSLVT